MNALQTKIHTSRTAALDRRAQRREDAVLAGELAGYASAADRLDLEAMMDRHSDAETADVRRALAASYA